MNKDKLNLFYQNKQRVEQLWQLLEVASQLADDLTDIDGNSLDHSVYEQLRSIDEQLYTVYDTNIKLYKPE